MHSPAACCPQSWRRFPPGCTGRHRIGASASCCRLHPGWEGCLRPSSHAESCWGLRELLFWVLCVVVLKGTSGKDRLSRPLCLVVDGFRDECAWTMNERDVNRTMHRRQWRRDRGVIKKKMRKKGWSVAQNSFACGWPRCASSRQPYLLWWCNEQGTHTRTYTHREKGGDERRGLNKIVLI